MRTTVLGFSACLSACVSTLPVANTSTEPLQPAKPVQEDQAPKPREQTPAVTRVVQSWTVNLESRTFPFEDQRPALPDAYANRFAYVIDRPLIGQTLHRLRLGFFANQGEAEQARVALSSQYPHAYIARAGSAERTQAAQHALAVKPPVTSGHDGPSIVSPTLGQPPSKLQSTAMSVLGIQPAEAPSPPAADAPPPAAPVPADLSPAHERLALSVDAPPPPPGSEPATEVSYGRDENESLYVRSTHNGGDVFTVDTAFSQRQDAHDLQKRAVEDQGFWQLDLSSGNAAVGPAFEAKLAQSSFDPETSEGFGAAENRLVSLATHGSWQGYQLGLGYQTVGAEFEKPSKAGERKKAVQHPNTELKQGRESTEVWVARQFGDLGLKTHATLYEDQVDGGDPITTQKVGASLNYTILSWPQVGVTVDYARGGRSAGASSGTGEPGDVDVQSVASSLYYAGAAWSGTLYLEDATGAGTDSPVDLRTYYLGGSYYPWSTFSLSPGLSYTEENYTEWGSTTDSYAASMTASYKPSAKSRYSFNGYSEYSTQQNLDWALDTEYYYNSVGVNWVSAKPKPLIKQWSLELFHDQYLDNVYTESNTGGFGVWLTMKSAPSPVNRFVEEVR